MQIHYSLDDLNLLVAIAIAPEYVHQKLVLLVPLPIFFQNFFFLYKGAREPPFGGGVQLVPERIKLPCLLTAHLSIFAICRTDSCLCLIPGSHFAPILESRSWALVAVSTSNSLLSVFLKLVFQFFSETSPVPLIQSPQLFQASINRFGFGSFSATGASGRDFFTISTPHQYFSLCLLWPQYQNHLLYFLA